MGPSGWVEYDFRVAQPGWHEIAFLGWGGGVELMIDADDATLKPSGTYFYGLATTGSQRQTVGNVWLTTGAHRVRVQRLYWTGLPAISAIEIKPNGNAIAGAFAAMPGTDPRIFRKDQCGTIDLVGGGTGAAATYQVFELDPRTNQIQSKQDVAFQPSRQPSTKRLALPCSRDGPNTLAFGAAGQVIPGLGRFSYEVVDTRPSPPVVESRDELVREIDCAGRSPDYVGSPTRVVRRRLGAYREAGSQGWMKYQQQSADLMRGSVEPGWFAYTLHGLVPQQRYRIEIDYPDDARRTFAIALREAAPLQYPVAIGVTSGGEYSTTDQLATQSMVVWPRTDAPRLLFITAHEEDAAACARIRIYRAAAMKPMKPAASGDHRQIVHWYEEGGNFESLFSRPDGDPATNRITADRWFETALANGVNLLMPTAAVYGSTLFPSRREITTFEPQGDDLRRLILLSEKHGIKLVPEIHPRGDELSRGYSIGAPPPDNLLVSKEGKTNFVAPDGKTRVYPPYFDPMDPRVQAWYLGLIGEIADRYKDSPAFDGVSLRYMQWSNGGFNNFVSLEWGYNDRTVALFRHETGQPVPLGAPADPGRFAQRHKWLTTVGREAWINWRCQKIGELMVRARDRVRQARPDLKLFLHIFGSSGTVPDPQVAPGQRGAAFDRLRQSGVDPTLLRQLPGVVLIDSSYAYGRRSPDSVFLGNHDNLLDPTSLSVVRDGAPGRFVLGMKYLEATEFVVPPQRLGLPAGTKPTWMSAQANPAGRHALERYAVALAETDALMLGDGGNGYTFGPPVVQQFIAEYLQLPSLPFAARHDALDPVTVRTLGTEQGLMFYAVNRERFPVTTTMTLNKTGKALRLSVGTPMPAIGRALTLELKPYELIVGRLDPGLEIDFIATRVAAGDRALVENRLRWLQRLATGKRATSSVEKAKIETAINIADEALSQGRVWRARTAMEHNSLLSIFRRLNCYPPGLFSPSTAQLNCDPEG